MQDNDEFDEAELQGLRERARALPREIQAAPEAWVNIRERIERSRMRELPMSIEHSGQTRSVVTSVDVTHADAKDVDGNNHAWNRPRIVFAAAAVLFIAVTTLTVVREGADNRLASKSAGADAGAVAAAPESRSQAVAPVAAASMEAVFAQYDAASSDLARDLEQRRSRLRPEAVAVLDSCLTTINRAIKESRTALAETPDNTTIADLLQLTYQQKIDLLRRAAELPLGSH